MNKGERFTAYLEHDERASLRELAKLHGRSENYVLRMALRALLFNNPVPTYLQTREKAEQ